MTIQLFIRGRLAREHFIQDWEVPVYYANYRKAVEGKSAPWEIYLIKAGRSKKMRPTLQKAWNKWLKENGSFKMDK